MGHTFPISTNQSPSIVLELIFRLKVRDVMSKNLHLATQETSLREIQQTMRKEKITGIPIIDNKNKLIGLVSMDDIVRALDTGHIEEKAETHMSRDLKVIEDDMPLTIAISDFKKFRFGRFPVIDKKQNLVGIITNGDITSKLLYEINKEVDKLEQQLPEKENNLQETIKKEYKIKRLDFENAGIASTEIKKKLKNRGVDSKTLRRIAIATYELEINITIHSQGGDMTLLINNDYVEIIAKDYGPGIENIKQVVVEGYTTATASIKALGFGAGMGLPNIKRVSDEFEISSELGKGTTVRSMIKIL